MVWFQTYESIQSTIRVFIGMLFSSPNIFIANDAYVVADCGVRVSHGVVVKVMN